MKNYYKNILLSFSSLILFIVLTELVTRVFWSPEKNNNQTRKGIVLAENNREFVYEGIEYNTNSLGIRYKELSLETDTNKYKILALGDSYVWGDGLRNGELVTIKLEKQLNELTGKKFEVINSGIGGFNTQDEYKQLVRLFPIYKPNLVIQFFFTNDILEKKNGEKVYDWKVNLNMWLRENSRFYAFLYYLIKSKFNAKINVPKFILPQDYFNLDDSKPGWVNFKTYTSKIKEFAEKNNTGYCFVFIPTLTTFGENYPYLELKQKVAEYVRSLKVPFLSFYNLFSKFEPIELWVSKRNTHWNGKATSMAADTLANFLIERKLLQFYF